MTEPVMAEFTDLAAAYRICRGIAARHGRTYFLATRLLPAQRRPAVHALYAFARAVDDVVDIDAGARRPWSDQARDLDRIERRLRGTGTPDELTPAWDPVFAAFEDTVRSYEIPREYFWAFLDSMRMDVPGTPLFRNRFADMAELGRYIYGSAAVIGLQLLPVLGTVVPVEEAAEPAAALGEAFQLTNFIRDVGEDLDRDRVYLPSDQLAAFGVDDELLAYCRRTGTSDRRVRAALAHLAALNRSIYRRARPGIAMLEPRVRPGISAAFTLYGEILDRIEHDDFAVLQTRAVVPRGRRLAVAVTELGKGVLRHAV
ncbi:phytoene/squalene synthase family protein [Aldersonia sp. NBC_00410]|uniref:phytoene/squalene synthase family protein n=1 Tax=Aldersonia sp. NBC_00410 TaxID=2975954 RepID=UPI00225AEC1B|nr:phytoene/squalene synthase family protein [Aldersonia sp. NBC_00410]MCX5045963.1 phytoene/squalene synthase family protein [Aldersonia sp. NBC_00410]